MTTAIIMSTSITESKPTSGKLLYRVNQLTAEIGISRAHLYQLVKRGEFPQPIKIGNRAIAWPAQAIEAWIAERAAAAQEAA